MDQSNKTTSQKAVDCRLAADMSKRRSVPKEQRQWRYATNSTTCCSTSHAETAQETTHLLCSHGVDGQPAANVPQHLGALLLRRVSLDIVESCGQGHIRASNGRRKELKLQKLQCDGTLQYEYDEDDAERSKHVSFHTRDRQGQAAADRTGLGHD